MMSGQDHRFLATLFCENLDWNIDVSFPQAVAAARVGCGNVAAEESLDNADLQADL